MLQSRVIIAVGFTNPFSDDSLSGIDYGNALLANAPRTWTDKLQRILNAAAQVITCTWKFDRGLTCILHDDVNWLYISQLHLQTA